MTASRSTVPAHQFAGTGPQTIIAVPSAMHAIRASSHAYADPGRNPPYANQQARGNEREPAELACQSSIALRLSTNSGWRLTPVPARFDA